MFHRFAGKIIFILRNLVISVDGDNKVLFFVSLTKPERMLFSIYLMVPLTMFIRKNFVFTLDQQKVPVRVLSIHPIRLHCLRMKQLPHLQLL